MTPPPWAGICSVPVRAITVRPAVIVTEMWHVLELKQAAGRPPTPLEDTNALRPAIPMCGPTDAVPDVARTWPFDPSACTSNTGMPVFAEIPVSNPPQRPPACGASEPALGPPSTRQDDTVVAPFQLAHTSVVPSLFGAAAMFGLVFGCPLQAN